MKRRIVVAVMMLAIMFMLVSSVAAKDKVEICHVLGNGGWMIKFVPMQALGGHLGHGDALYVAGICMWPEEEELPPIVAWISYYIPFASKFFDWQYCLIPPCPQDGDSVADHNQPPILEAYP